MFEGFFCYSSFPEKEAFFGQRTKEEKTVILSLPIPGNRSYSAKIRCDNRSRKKPTIPTPPKKKHLRSFQRSQRTRKAFPPKKRKFTFFKKSQQIFSFPFAGSDVCVCKARETRPPSLLNTKARHEQPERPSSSLCLVRFYTLEEEEEEVQRVKRKKKKKNVWILALTRNNNPPSRRMKR